MERKMASKKLEFLEKRLTTINASSTKTDQKVIDFLKDNSEEFAKLSITELADKIGISVSAITRFVKKLGYEKLTDLKLDLSKCAGTSVSTQYNGIDKRDDLGMIAAKVLTRDIEAIQDVKQMLKKQDLEKVLKLLLAARKIVFTGLGGSASVAQDAYHKFRRLGTSTELVTDSNSQMIIASIGSKKDVIVVISNEGTNKDLNLALKTAKDNGMKIIAITQFGNSPLVKIADVSLVTLSHGYCEKPEPLISRIAAYSIIDVIYIAYFIQSSDSLENQLIKIRDNIKLFKNYEN